jgi:hypothetical protein
MEYDIGYRITRRPDFLSTSVSNYNISKEWACYNFLNFT